MFSSMIRWTKVNFALLNWANLGFRVRNRIEVFWSGDGANRIAWMRRPKKLLSKDVAICLAKKILLFCSIIPDLVTKYRIFLGSNFRIAFLTVKIFYKILSSQNSLNVHCMGIGPQIVPKNMKITGLITGWNHGKVSTTRRINSHLWRNRVFEMIKGGFLTNLGRESFIFKAS